MTQDDVLELFQKEAAGLEKLILRKMT